jgi:hypothetical protein
MRITTLLLLVCLICQTLSAQTTTIPTLTKADYLQKSKSQNTTAWLLLGGGATSSAIGIIIGFKEATDSFASIFSTEIEEPSSTGTVLFIAGAVTMLSSVPFFIASTNNKKKASNLSGFLKMENRPLLYQNNLSKSAYPAIGIKIIL